MDAMVFDDNVHDVLTSEGGLIEGVRRVSIGQEGDGTVLLSHAPVHSASRSDGRTTVNVLASCDPSSGCVRAGDAATSAGGGVSIVLSIDCDMPSSTMARAMVTATEAVTCVLQDLDVRDAAGEMCTGCSNFSIAVVRNRGSGLFLRGAGKHSILGQYIGEAVYEAVRASAESVGTRRPSDVAGVLSSMGYPEDRLFAMSGCADRGAFSNAFAKLSGDPVLTATVSSLAFLADEASWGLIPEDAARRVAGDVASGVLGVDISSDTGLRSAIAKAVAEAVGHRLP